MLDLWTSMKLLMLSKLETKQAQKFNVRKFSHCYLFLRLWEFCVETATTVSFSLQPTSLTLLKLAIPLSIPQTMIEGSTKEKVIYHSIYSLIIATNEL